MQVNRFKLLALAIFTTISLSAGIAKAAPIVDFTGGRTEGVIGEVTYGYDFTVESGLFEATGLGVFESFSRPLESSHSVGLWDDGGILLASTTVDGLDSIVASTSAIGQWRVSDIDTIILGAGRYYVGAHYSASDIDDVLVIATDNAISGITYGSARFAFGAFSFPASAFGTSLLGGTVVGAAAVPSPATLALFGLGLAGLGWSRRKKA